MSQQISGVQRDSWMRSIEMWCSPRTIKRRSGRDPLVSSGSTTLSDASSPHRYYTTGQNISPHCGAPLADISDSISSHSCLLLSPPHTVIFPFPPGSSPTPSGNACESLTPLRVAVAIATPIARPFSATARWKQMGPSHAQCLPSDRPSAAASSCLPEPPEL